MFISRHFRQWRYTKGLHQGPQSQQEDGIVERQKMVGERSKSSGDKGGIRAKCFKDAR